MKPAFKKYNFFTLFVPAMIFAGISLAKSAVISKYQNTFYLARDKNKEDYVVIRSFILNGNKKFLAVDTKSLVTKVFSSKKLKILNKAKIISNTHYGKALEEYTAPPYTLENYGAKSSHRREGVYLTIDMCPSAKRFEKEFFERLIEKKAPVAISLTGKWVQKHAQEFAWLLKQQNDKKLNITWINHSYNHYYPTKISLSSPDEIFLLEKMLLAKGQTPSVFFRFPALLSDQAAVITLRSLGLIPIASDAWLAKQEQAQAGSIILVHGNGNEPDGIEMAIDLLMHGHKLLPISEAFFEKR